MQTQRGEMQSMGLSLQASFYKVKGKMAEEIGTVRGEMTELRGSVKGVWSAMEAGKEDVTEKIMTVGREVDKLEQGMKEVKKGQGQRKREMEKTRRR